MTVDMTDHGGVEKTGALRELLADLTGKPVDDSVVVFPPFYSEFGKNLTLGKDVFINSGCRFQDTGGITIGDGVPARLIRATGFEAPPR